MKKKKAKLLDNNDPSKSSPKNYFFGNFRTSTQGYRSFGYQAPSPVSRAESAKFLVLKHSVSDSGAPTKKKDKNQKIKKKRENLRNQFY